MKKAIASTPLEIVSKALKRGRLAHAYIIAGPNEQKRTRAVRELGLLLLCERPVDTGDVSRPCQRCLSCKKAKKASHPDLIEIIPQGAYIRIEQIRNLQQRVIFAPLEAERRVVIIHSTEAMNIGAANALLKILEEPPEHTKLLLSASSCANILPTIISRCQVLRLSLKEGAGQDLEGAAARIGRKHSYLLDFLTGELSLQKDSELKDAFEIRDRLVQFFVEPQKRLLFLTVGAFISSSYERMRLAITILKTLIRDLLYLKTARGESFGEDDSGQKYVVNNDILASLRQLAQLTNYDTLIDYEKRLNEAKAMLERHVKAEMIADMLLAFWVRNKSKRHQT